MHLIPPPRLRKGDVIGVIAPSSPQRDDERLKSGIRYFESLGYRVKPGENLWKRYGYLAGSDEERGADLNAMLRDPEVHMIIAGRGGYGMTRILDRIDYRAARRDPKIIVGFSDVTALNCAMLVRAGLVTFSGAMPGVDFWDTGNIDPLAEESFWRAITSPKPLGTIRQPAEHPIARLHSGATEGWLLPGNLTLLATLTGTPYLPKPAGAILLVEEIGEEAYRVDRMLSQLYNAGVMQKIVGLAFGAFTGTKPTRVSVDPLPMEEVFAEYVRRANVPTVGGLLYGHITTKLTLPVGVRTRINGSRGTMALLEAGVV
jgi:muramoyltetrapeptide carboxypeptidase